MTNREFFNAVAAGISNEEIIEHATLAIEKMNAADARRASKPTKKALENAPIVDAILAYLGEQDEFTEGAVIAEAVGVTTQKAVGIMNQLAKDGKIMKEDIKLPKKGVRKGFKLAE